MGHRRRFGSVRRLPSGRWQARYRTSDGRQHTAPQTFPTRTEAIRYLTTVEVDLSRGQWTNPRLGRATFSGWAERWQQTTTNLRPNTQALHRYLLRRFLLPAFGTTPLADLDVMAVRAWLAELQAASVHPSTSAKAYRLLARILDTAVEAGRIPRNPCTVKGAASERAPEMRVATVAQVAALAEAVGSQYKALVLVAAYAGLRWGELAGLRVKHVDVLHAQITVAEQVTEIAGRFTWGPPKTQAGRRMVTLPSVAATALEAHLRTWADRDPDGLVFTAPQGGLLRRSNFCRRVWLPATRVAGVGGAALPRPSPYGRDPGHRRRGEHPGADGPDGTCLLGGGAALPARHGRPGPGHRGRAR
jgi:integrase